MKRYLIQLEEYVARRILARVASRLREELDTSYGRTPEALPSVEFPRLTWGGNE